MSFVADIQANIDDFQRNLDRAQARMDIFANTVGKKLEKIGQNFQAVGGVLTIGLTAPIVALGTAAIKTYGDIQSLKMGLEAIMGSASLAEEEFTKLLEVAKLPGLGLKEAAKGSVALQSAGFSADEARRSLMAFGNALATVGKGANELSLVNLALTQLQNKSSGFGQDLRQLTEQLPQLRGAMMEAFGTSDSEKIAKLGFTGAQVVQKLTDEFEKLPKVTGGIKNAFENIQDAITISLSKIGESINKNFDVEGRLSKMSDLLVSLTDKFAKLDAPTQKFILTATGIVASIGPLLIGLGGILKLAPLVGTAFATLTGPIGISIAAIAAGAVLIIKNWDSIKSYFTSGNGAKIWGNISNGAQKVWSNLVKIFNAVKEFIIAVWDKIGSNVMSIVGNTFDTVFAIIGSVIGQIIGVINVFTSLIRGDFSGAFEAAKNVVKGIFNAIKTIVINVLANVTQALSAFLKFIGADNLGASLENWANGLKPVQEETVKTAEKVEEVSNKLGAQTKRVKENTESLEENKKKQVDYRKELDNTLASWGIYDSQIKVLNRTFKELDNTAKAAKATQEELQTILSRNWLEKTLLDFQKLGNDPFKNSNLTTLSGGFTVPIKLDLQLAGGKYETIISNLGATAKSELEDLSKQYDEIISQGVFDIAESIGTAFIENNNLLAAVGQSVLSTAGGILKNLGKIAIQEGLMVAGMGKALAAAVAALKSLNPAVAIAAGVALTALGAAFTAGSAKLGKSMESGGGSSAYTASSQSIQQSFPRGAYYNNDKQEVELKIKNGDLRGSIKWGDNRNNRIK